MNKRLLLALLIPVGIVVGLKSYVSVCINQSQSLPQRAFLLLKGVSCEKGDYVAFSHPKFPNLLIKQVVGVSGDRVHQSHEAVWVDSQKIGAQLPRTKEGLSLTPLRFRGPIPKNHMFVASPHERSFDSRYEEVGLLKCEKTLGRAIPLF